MWGLTRLDLGKSLWTGESVGKEIAQRFPVSLQVSIMDSGSALDAVHFRE